MRSVPGGGTPRGGVRPELREGSISPRALSTMLSFLEGLCILKEKFTVELVQVVGDLS